MIENVINFIAAFWWVWPISGLCSGLIFASIVADKKKPISSEEQIKISDDKPEKKWFRKTNTINI